MPKPNYQSLRHAGNIEPRMRIKDARQTFAGIWIRQLLQGKPIEIWAGGQLRDFTFIDAAVDALLSNKTSASGGVTLKGSADPA